jgi:hypothetical protein
MIIENKFNLNGRTVTSNKAWNQTL